jgi:hypothetical protein
MTHSVTSSKRWLAFRINAILEAIWRTTAFDIVTVIGPKYEVDALIGADRKLKDHKHGPLSIEVEVDVN